MTLGKWLAKKVMYRTAAWRMHAVKNILEYANIVLTETNSRIRYTGDHSKNSMILPIFDGIGRLWDKFSPRQLRTWASKNLFTCGRYCLLHFGQYLIPVFSSSATLIDTLCDIIWHDLICFVYIPPLVENNFPQLEHSFFFCLISLTSSLIFSMRGEATIDCSANPLHLLWCWKIVKLFFVFLSFEISRAA